MVDWMVKHSYGFRNEFTYETFFGHIATTAVNHGAVDSSLGNEVHQYEETVATVSNDETPQLPCCA